METIAEVDVQASLSISRRAGEMQGSPIRKLAATAEARKKQEIKVYHLNIGQPDLPTSPAVFEAIRKFDQKTIAYAPSNGLSPALSGWKAYFHHVGIEFDEKEMIVTTGGSEAIVMAMIAVCDGGDEIIVFEPFYTNYNGFASIASVKLRPVPLSIRNGFHLPPIHEIEPYITTKTKAFIINSPSNPTGAVYSREEMQRIVDLAKRHNLFVISDEAYREFAYESKAVGIMEFPEIRDRAILVDSCSKRFNVCGARIGVIASHNAEVIASALKFGQARLSVATIEQIAVAPLLSNPLPYTRPIVEEFRKRRDVVIEALKKIPGVACYRPEGAFYIVIGLPVNNAEDFSKWMIEEFEHKGETVLVAPGQGFYATKGKGINEVRLAFMLNVDDMKQSLVILGAALKEYKRKGM
jgi:aspartate aminotransferase